MQLAQLTQAYDTTRQDDPEMRPLFRLASIPPEDQDAPTTPQTPQQTQLDDWKEPQPPAMKPTAWLKQLASRLEQEKERPGDELASIIKAEFDQHKIEDKTKVVYMSWLKSMLIENGTLINPLFEEAFEETHEPYLEKYRSLKSGYAKRVFLELLNEVEPFTVPFLRTDIVVDGELIRHNLGKEVRKVALKKQMEKKSFTIEDPEEFKKKVLAGLDEYDSPQKLFPALLLACGRRPASLFIPIGEVWDMEGLRYSGSQIRYTETVKKRGKPVTEVITLLCSAHRFVTALEVFQELHKKNIYGRKLVEWCSWLRCKERKLTPRDFRVLYAKYIEQMSRKSGKTGPVNVARALMHGNLNSSALYMSVNFES